MNARLARLYFILVAAQYGGGGFGYPIDKTYTLHASKGKAAILSFHFTREQGGRVFITSIQGRLPRGEYDCGYYIDQNHARYILTLVRECSEIVIDSLGYYDGRLLNDSLIVSTYKSLYVPTVSNGYDVYKLI
ncbi:hypothetical protein FOZ62_000775 [Perkinsus olseni]|uniref:Uncharacterized protein n=2 Tax=Perkinsus olseni TaxID=32597 RepID=A0A7J6QRH7_PEROL|nr:hypothetical protein FOZ62_000775 [Perkinsus olseni]